MNNPEQRHELENELLQARSRLNTAMRNLEGGATGGQAYLHAFAAFSEALLAAGLASKLGLPLQEIRELLNAAARACLEVYRWRDTLLSSITYLPSEEEKIFIDDTAANPANFVMGVYAAMAAHSDELVERFKDLVDIEVAPQGVTIIQELAQYSLALHSEINSKTEDALSILIPLIRIQPYELSEQYWISQAIALYQILSNNQAASQAALADVKEVHEQYYRELNASDSPEYSLQLPLLGLRAIKQRRDYGD